MREIERFKAQKHYKGQFLFDSLMVQHFEVHQIQPKSGFKSCQIFQI